MVQLSLPDPKASQAEQILNWLKAGNSITPLQALERFKCMRLGARCFQLRKEGYDIRSQMVKVASGKHVAEYSLVMPDSNGTKS